MTGLSINGIEKETDTTYLKYQITTQAIQVLLLFKKIWCEKLVFLLVQRNTYYIISKGNCLLVFSYEIPCQFDAMHIQ